MCPGAIVAPVLYARPMSYENALPPDVPGEDEPPELSLAVVAVLLLFADLGDALGDRYTPELRGRVGAVSAVLKRLPADEARGAVDRLEVQR